MNQKEKKKSLGTVTGSLLQKTIICLHFIS